MCFIANINTLNVILKSPNVPLSAENEQKIFKFVTKIDARVI